MVYDASIAGVNDNLWAPSFPLQDVNSLLRALEDGTWMGDVDIAEMEAEIEDTFFVLVIKSRDFWHFFAVVIIINGLASFIERSLPPQFRNVRIGAILKQQSYHSRQT